ncbi:unnamed protein product [Orchesella dallaii]|uniref:UDP-glucuronosyltransferase n=1 Tax=Orchesella dallaii TaxID=48710 RepID=A0ABP1QQ72_9HEXA
MKLVHILSLGGFLLLLHISTADKILFLLPIASKSHVNVFAPMIRALGERGHEIVNLSPVKSPNMPPNVKQIQIYPIEKLFNSMGDPFEMRKMGKFNALFNGSFNNLMDSCRELIKTDTFQELAVGESFDLIIVDIFMNYCVLGIVPLLQAPSIMVSTFAAPPILANSFGNRLPTSFVPDWNLDYTHQMSFTQRLMNVISTGISDLIMRLMFIKPSEKIYMENLPNGAELPSVAEIQANASMLFMNSHFTINHPRPLLPDVIEVGGMHTRPAKPLPKDLDTFLTDSGEDGFIVFSLGSIVPARLMPEEFRKIFIRVFGRLKQRVVWKWETGEMPDTPPNVLIRKWLPQQDILGHPNVKLFMTHGGLLSTQESVYHGVPLLGFPMFGDQDMNIKQAETAGYAKFFEILELSEEKLENAINEMINNAKYSVKAKELSKLVRDVPQTPLEKAVYWVEYVLRHKGAPHLRSAARDLNFVQYYLLDVTLAVILITTSILVGVYLVLKRVAVALCGKKSSNKLKKQ